MRDRQFSQGSPRRLRIPRPDRKIQAPSAIVPTRCVVNVARSIICPGRARAIERQQEALAETEAISAMASRDRKSVVSGKGGSIRVDRGGRGSVKKKKRTNTNHKTQKNNKKL